jgi:hypothetical protein
MLDGGYYNPKAEIAKTRKATPKSGWLSFNDYIFRNGILFLPSSENTVADFITPDIDSYAIEISTDKYYRFIDYPRPIEVYEESPNAKAMENFLRYLESEFKFKRLGY